MKSFLFRLLYFKRTPFEQVNKTHACCFLEFIIFISSFHFWLAYTDQYTIPQTVALIKVLLNITQILKLQGRTEGPR